MDNYGKMTNAQMLMLGIGAFLVLAYMGVIPIQGITPPTVSGGTVTTTTTTPTTTTPPIVSTITDVTASLLPYNPYAPGSTLDTEGVIMLNGSTAFDSCALGTDTVKLSPGKEVKIVVYDDGQTTKIDGSTSCSLDSSNDWYGYMETVTIPWESTFQWSKALYKQGVYTSWAKNADGTINGVAGSKTELNMSPGAEKTVRITFKGPNDAAYGDCYSPKGLVWMEDDNQSAYSSIKVTSADGAVKSTGVLGAARTYAETAWELPFSCLKDQEEKTIDVTLKMRDGIADANKEWAVHWWLADTALYFDEEGTGFKYANEDEEDSADIGYPNSFTGESTIRCCAGDTNAGDYNAIFVN